MSAIAEANGRTLTTTERQRFVECEKLIDSGMPVFLQVGAALKEIRDNRYYREDFESFEKYLSNKHGISRARAYQLILTVEIREELLSTRVDNSYPSSHPEPPEILPETAKQAQELSRLPSESRAAAWSEAVATAPKANGKPKVTASHVRKVVERKKKPAPAPKPEPTEKPKDEPPADAPVLDGLGKPVEDPKLQEVFRNAGKFDEALSIHRQLVSLVNSLLGDEKPMPGAEMLCMAGGERQALERELKNVRVALKFARPFAPCPYPHSKGTKCTACHGHGWVTKNTWDNAPKSYTGGRGAA